jgi:hypothetical protein
MISKRSLRCCPELMMLIICSCVRWVSFSNDSV